MLPPTVATISKGAEVRRGEVLLFIPWAIGTLLLASNWIGPQLFLVFVFGWKKVQQQHLTLVATPKGHPWPVSNGEFITHDFFAHYVISLCCCLILFIVTYLPVRLMLPRLPPVA